MHKLSRRDVLKLGGTALGGLALSPLLKGQAGITDASLIRIATNSLSVYREPTDKSTIVGTWYRDDLLRVYGEVKGIDGEPKNNPIWYRVWGGYLHRGRIQHVKILYNKPLDSIPEGKLQLMEVTTPYTTPFRNSKARGWESIDQVATHTMAYGSVHWANGIETGPDGTPWYRILDELDSNVPYFVPAIHMRPIPAEDLSPLSADVPKDQKRIEVNLSAQTLTAYEYNKPVIRFTISSGIPAGDFKTPDGDFNIEWKVPAKHMGNSYFGLGKSGDVYNTADVDNYILPGVPWSCFFTNAGHAFHGTYWHENFGAPMSHGCINMRTAEAKWIFRWVRPLHTVEGIASKTSFGGELGTAVNIHY